MRIVFLVLKESPVLIGPVYVAQNFFARLRGLFFRPKLRGREAMLLKDCSSVHTFGMTYSIDVLFLSFDGNILSIKENLRPCRLAYFFKADMVLELHAGQAKQLNLRVTDILSLL